MRSKAPKNSSRSRKPANRHKTGFRGPSPDVGKETQFKPGQPSPNPTGRPKRRPVTEAYLEAMSLPLPNEIRVQLRLPKGATYLQALALGTIRAGVKGNYGAAEEIREATEGKATQRIELTGESGGPVVAKLDAATTIASIREFYGLSDRSHRPDPANAGGTETQRDPPVPVSESLAQRPEPKKAR